MHLRPKFPWNQQQNMSNQPHDVTAAAAVGFARNLLRHLAEKYGGETTLNELRVINQVIRCHLKGRYCSVTALHRETGIPIPTVSRVIANLQSDDWLSERQDPTDGRKRIITLGPRSLQRTSDDIDRGIGWINDFLEQGLPT